MQSAVVVETLDGRKRKIAMTNRGSTMCHPGLVATPSSAVRIYRYARPVAPIDPRVPPRGYALSCVVPLHHPLPVDN